MSTEPSKDMAAMISEFVDVRAERFDLWQALTCLVDLLDRAQQPDYENVEPTNEEWTAAWNAAREALGRD